jgi:endonuclease YncB( thermonuclease family)
MGGMNLNGWMVRQGWAVAFRKYGIDYVPEEDDARTNRRGLWSGTFDMPWDWRAVRRP